MANIIQAFPKGNGTNLNIIAEEFDDAKSYAINDRCIKDKVLYKCVTPHTGAWVAGDFAEVTLDDVIPKPLTDTQLTDVKSGFTPKNVSNLNLIGLPTGGEIGQLLSKKSVNDYDVEWSNVIYKNISGTYTGDYVSIEKYIAEIINAQTWKPNTVYIGAIRGIHDGAGSSGSWWGFYIGRVMKVNSSGKPNDYGTVFFVGAQDFCGTIRHNGADVRNWITQKATITATSFSF